MAPHQKVTSHDWQLLAGVEQQPSVRRMEQTELETSIEVKEILLKYSGQRGRYGGNLAMQSTL